MATAQVLASAAREQGWLMRVGYFVMKAAVAVMTEDGGTASHAERLAYAKKVLAGTASVESYALAVLTNATIAASGSPLATSDSDMEFTVNSLFTSIALSAV